MHISDWKSHVFSSALLDFTYQTLLYASCSRGYKAGGINPPTPGYATGEDLVEAGYISQEALDNDGKFFDFYPVLYLTSVNYEPTFDPEFVNAFEIGLKNVLMGGRLTLNAGAFFYDYADYQVSQIRDRTAVNERSEERRVGKECVSTCRTRG